MESGDRRFEDQTLAGAGSAIKDQSSSGTSKPNPLKTDAGFAAADLARAPVSSSATLEPGTLLGGRYEVITMLGIGGMGAVYKAYDRDIERAIALKVIRPDLAANPELLQRFKQELLLARQIAHKNVVRIFDLQESGGLKYITMEYIDGCDLRSLLAEHRKLPISEALEIIRRVCAGLAAAHDEGVIHRDLKPGNIMRDAHGRVIVMDFGLARTVETEGLTQTGAMLGTMEYMSPEQARGGAVDARSDLYAVGLIAYELLTGKSPFPAPSAMASLVKRTETSAKSVCEEAPEVPKAIGTIVAKCLATKPEARYQSAAEIITDLDRATGHVPSAILAPAARAWYMSPAVVILVAGVMIAAAVGLYVALRPKPTIAHAPVSVLIADFQNQTSDPLFDGTLEPAFSVALEGAPFITSYNRGQAHKVASRIANGATTLNEGLARLVAVSEGIALVLGGEIALDVDGGYKIKVEAADAATGRIICTAKDRVNNKDAMLVAVAKLASQVRRKLGDLTPESVQLSESETFSAASLDAAHEYATAQESFWNGKHDDAVQHYLKAINLDTNLGRAYSGLAAVYQHVGRLQEAEKSYRDSLSKLDRMTDREKFRTRGAYYLLTRNNDKAIEELSQLVRQYPSDSAGMGNLALAYFYKRQMVRALELGKQAVAIYPNNVPYRSNVALYAMYAGDFDTAIKEENAVLKINPTYEKAYVAIAMSQLAQGNISAAADSYARLQTVSPRGRSMAASGLADLALYQGKIQQAIEILEKAAPEDIAAKNVDAAAQKFVLLSEAETLIHHSTNAINAADRALAFSQQNDILFWAARTYLEASNQRKALVLAQQLERKLAPDSQAYGKLLEGEIWLEQGKPQEALGRFEEAKQISDLWMGRLDSAIAYVQKSEFAEADSELENCLKRRGEAVAVFLDEAPTYHVFPPALYYLGRAQEGLNSPAAAESYKTFIATKENGDQDPLLPDARRRVGSR